MSGSCTMTYQCSERRGGRTSQKAGRPSLPPRDEDAAELVPARHDECEHVIGRRQGFVDPGEQVIDEGARRHAIEADRVRDAVDVIRDAELVGVDRDVVEHEVARPRK